MDTMADDSDSHNEQQIARDVSVLIHQPKTYTVYSPFAV